MDALVAVLSSPEAWMSLLTLTFLEIILGIDNIIFISIAAGKLPKEQQGRATNIGMILAMVFRIALLFGISWLISMSASLFYIDLSWLKAAPTGQSLILLAGGLFLLYKSVSEIHHKLEGEAHDGNDAKKKKGVTLQSVIIQICIINIVFSFDSILTAVGMTNGVPNALLIMIIAVVISVIIMMLFAVPVGRFVNQHPTIQILGLSFLKLIGFMLITEAAHLAHFSVLGSEVGVIPKGYLYFAIFFSMVVEFLNMRLRKKSKNVVQLHDVKKEAVKVGLLEKNKR